MGSSPSTPTMKKIHAPEITTDGFWYDHDVACAVCSSNHAVYYTNIGVFEPCWTCQSRGWMIQKFSPTKAKRLRKRRHFRSHRYD